MKDGFALPSCPSLSLTVLASGSRGNCIYIESEETAILVDAGFSCKELLRRMDMKGLLPEKLSALVLSHEHSDHVTGAGVLSRKLHLPVYGTSGTLDAAKNKTGVLHRRKDITCGVPFAVGDLLIHPFSISHDASDPAGFTVSSGGLKIGIATDLGIATTLVKNHLKGCHALVLEANHCPVMLENGPYPWSLKQRVKGRTGHLSNGDARDLLGEIIHPALSSVVIAHISEKNNTPEKAGAVVAEALKNSRAKLVTACQQRPADPIRLTSSKDSWPCSDNTENFQPDKLHYSFAD
ncbi:phosphoribosyl 1,2-cyclic phosphodiesterase [Desulfobotulus alkaliphilus]|uniref:Phosphoribosyl 1,2-cyclic phosphodiesterase n=1 Tax=Desulfobotulus alkaliphilus TaxID=622671 RepID=A0A562RAF3_9BACT|nr:MBL fold metallo-hydrolase [Desulfobotulus alkaliphilus]TWI66051.1 phosphoribosyl 1,2-cyclic phosphodiesterase [Desulfobotulus alkaliphilus]